jgi:hypothetical protein
MPGIKPGMTWQKIARLTGIASASGLLAITICEI